MQLVRVTCVFTGHYNTDTILVLRNHDILFLIYLVIYSYNKITMSTATQLRPHTIMISKIHKYVW